MAVVVVVVAVVVEVIVVRATSALRAGDAGRTPDFEASAYRSDRFSGSHAGHNGRFR